MEPDYRKAANITVIVAGILLFSWFFFKYALGASIPFLLAAAIAAILSPAADKISKKLKLPHKLTATVLVLLFFAVLISLAYFAGYRLVGEAGNLLDRLSDDPEIISKTLETILEKLSSLTSRFGFLNRFFESDTIQNLGIDLDSLLSQALSSIITSITGALPTAAAAILAKIPEFFLFLIVTVISTFYFSTDRVFLSDSLTSILPDGWVKNLPTLKNKISDALRGYVKAYLLIMLMTFCEIFLGLSVLGVNYAFILSMIIAVVDILPILGAGTVIVPWAIFSLLTSNYKLGIGLLIIYAVISIIRQIAEPRIVGTSLGLHPLATLASIYISVKFIGISGIIIGPIVALLICNLFKGEDEIQSDEQKAQKIDQETHDKKQGCPK